MSPRGQMEMVRAPPVSRPSAAVRRRSPTRRAQQQRCSFGSGAPCLGSRRPRRGLAACRRRAASRCRLQFPSSSLSHGPRQRPCWSKACVSGAYGQETASQAVCGAAWKRATSASMQQDAHFALCTAASHRAPSATMTRFIALAACVALAFAAPSVSAAHLRADNSTLRCESPAFESLRAPLSSAQQHAGRQPGASPGSPPGPPRRHDCAWHVNTIASLAVRFARRPCACWATRASPHLRSAQ